MNFQQHFNPMFRHLNRPRVHPLLRKDEKEWGQPSATNPATIDDYLLELEEISRKTVNEMVMDYLVKQGFEEAAKAFAEEAGMQLPPDFDMKATHRVTIRDLIRNGNVDEAIKLINVHFPTFLEENPSTAMDILHLKLVELIRARQNDKALEFAQDILSKHLEEVGDIDNRCEKTMALLIYDNPEKSPFKEILDLDLRRTVAANVSDALLLDCEPGVESQTSVTSLMNKLVFIQDELEKANITYPKVVDFANATLKMSDDVDEEKEGSTKKDD